MYKYTTKMTASKVSAHHLYCGAYIEAEHIKGGEYIQLFHNGINYVILMGIWDRTKKHRLDKYFLTSETLSEAKKLFLGAMHGEIQIQNCGEKY